MCCLKRPRCILGTTGVDYQQFWLISCPHCVCVWSEEYQSIPLRCRKCGVKKKKNQASQLVSESVSCRATHAGVHDYTEHNTWFYILCLLIKALPGWVKFMQNSGSAAEKTNLQVTGREAVTRSATRKCMSALRSRLVDQIKTINKDLWADCLATHPVTDLYNNASYLCFLQI